MSPATVLPSIAGQNGSGHREQVGHEVSKEFACAKVMCNAFPCCSSTNPETQYPHYSPAWTPDHEYPPLEAFEHHDHAKDADPTFPSLNSSSAHISHMTPSTGSEISGIQLSSFTPQAKDELALLVAQRKVVAFRSQDFKDLLPIPSVLDFCRYFGPLTIFPSGPYLPHSPEIHIAHSK